MNDLKKLNYFSHPVWSYGFRAFFVLAGFSAIALIALWSNLYNGDLSHQNYYSLVDWHAHEMLVGYTSAVIAGFLLTAVSNWTGLSTTRGRPLFFLCILWLYGRILPFYSGLLSDWLIAAVDFIFLPALIYQLSKPIYLSNNKRSVIFLFLLAFMTVANALIHLQALGVYQDSGRIGILLLLAFIILMILVIAGRIFPFFIERALPGVIMIKNPLWDILSILTSVIVFTLFIFEIYGIFLTLFACAAVVFNILRLSDWYDRRIWYVPLLWILFVGYLWIVIGFVLAAFYAYQLVSYSLVIHAFTLGGIGVLTLGMMARVSLGHTGRVLKISNIIALAFVLINTSALLRVIVPIVMPQWYGFLINVSIFGWLATYSLFMVVYVPILTAPRIDYKPG